MKSHDRNSFFKSSRKSRSIVSQPILYATGIVAVILLFQIFAPNMLAGFFGRIFLPFWSESSSLSSGAKSVDLLTQENQMLTEQLAAYSADASSSIALANENDELKSLMYRPGATANLLLASVVKGPPGAGYDFLILDVGTADGVIAGDPVYTAGNMIIGQVIESQSHTSKAELYSSPGTSYNVLIGPNHIPATATGQGGGYFSASISREAGVNEGDQVIIPDIRSSSFGAVSAVISDPAQPFAQIMFGNPVNIYELRWVGVATSTISAKPFLGTKIASTTAATTTSAAAGTASKKH
jgi:cell shape-determining protein MreC